MSQEQKTWTYRVRQLPLEFGKAEVISTLQRHLQQNTDPPQVRVYSLAQDLASFHTSRTKTATVTIVPLPEHLKTHTRWNFRTNYQGWKYDIVVDREFLDFTVLNEVRKEEHKFDCIAISGLGSHPFGSWQCRGGSPFMWLRDGIPHDLHGIRSIIYGYDSQVPKSNSFQRPHDIAARFVNRLISVGFGSSRSKPLIFLAHSLGGIILKEVLIILAGISDQEYSILENLKLVIFFGVPHQGMSTERLVTMVKDQPNENLVHDLSPGSSYLYHVEERFNGVHIHREFRIVSFYETKTTRTVQQNNNGGWSRTGPPARMVDRESAIHKQSRGIYPIDENHSEMVKFPPGDLNYKCVLDCLEEALGKRRTKQLRRDSRLSEDDPTMTSKEDEKVTTEAIIASLELEILDRRITDVSRPHKSTFNWIFNEEDLGFTTWLLEGQGAYWIRGKPGSGKSTLLKHITQHQDTRDILQRWSRLDVLQEEIKPKKPIEPIVAAFFFYYRGSRIQKSFDGLIRSILCQILKAAPHLCRFIPEKCFPQPGRKSYDWSPTNLDDALQSVLAQRPSTLKVCLFIDALDEFDGHLEVLADFLKNLIKARCKICFSSRPRDILEKHFGSCPGISMHDHTKMDIHTYTLERLANLPDLRNPSHITREMRDAVNNAVKAIKRKAEGVFLWVKLALDRIEQDRVTTSNLSERLRELPAELEDFYASIIERIPHEFRWETYLILDVMIRYHEEPSVLMIFQIVECAQCQTMDECFEKLRGKPGSSQFCHHLKERCGGLIETGGRLQFMHETVREFISGPRFQELIVGPAAIINAQNGYTELAKIFIAAMRCPPDIDMRFVDSRRLHLKLCLRYCHFAESTTGICQSEFINALEPRVLKEISDLHHEVNKVSIAGFPTSAVDFAVRSGLSIYIQQQLENSENLESIVEEALQSVFSTLVDIELNDRGEEGKVTSYSWYDDYDPDPHGLAQILLKDPRSRHFGVAAFGSLLFTRFRKGRYHDDLESRIVKLHMSEPILDLARIFLDNGMDPNVEMTEKSTFAINPCGDPRGPRPLHLAFGKIAELFLSHNADPNAKDRVGRTPLDVAIQRLKIYRRTPACSLIVRDMDMLMGSGACITRVGLKLFSMCISVYQGRGRSLERLLDLPRRSAEHGFLSNFDRRVLLVATKVGGPIRTLLYSGDGWVWSSDYL